MKLYALLSTIVISTSSLLAGGQTYYDYAKVTRSEPVFEYVYEKEPKTECKEEKIQLSNHKDNYFSDNSIGWDTIIGATTGVVLGNQIGSGNGRTAAKIIGGIAGGAIANNLRTKEFDNTHSPSYEIRTRCYESSTMVKRKMITGYKNYFVYNGSEHVKVTNKPRKKVRITHSIDF